MKWLAGDIYPGKIIKMAVPREYKTETENAQNK